MAFCESWSKMISDVKNNFTFPKRITRTAMLKIGESCRRSAGILHQL
jgi:hypothetical protein